MVSVERAPKHVHLSDPSVESMAHHVFVNERHRLVLFTIPKVGCTELIKLMRRMNGSIDWHDRPHFKPDRPYLKKLDRGRVEEIINSPSWTKAVLLRDPAERLLSAYLNKFIYTWNYAANVFRPKGRGMPFSEFLEYVLDSNRDRKLPTGLHEGTDPHWRPQRLVGPIEEVASTLSSVGDFHARNSWIRDVLRTANCWERYGASGWGTDGKQEIFTENTYPRRTDAACRMAEYYDSETLGAVYRAYAGDVDFARQWGIDLIQHPHLLA